MESPADPHDKKLIVAIIFGGKSAEHEVSLKSAANVAYALDLKKFIPVLISIDKTGIWRLEQYDQTRSKDTLSVCADSPEVHFAPGTGQLVCGDPNFNGHIVDVVFPVLHGPLGEDGSVQGYLEVANLPYVGPGVLGSAVGMDKDVMKQLLQAAGIQVAPFLTFHVSNRQSINPTDVFTQLGTTVFVKPANMGSSVGVSRASTTQELEKAIEDAFRYDVKIIIEQAIIGDEIECSVLGNDQPQASVIGKIIPRANDFYSYDAKYIDAQGAVLEIPAEISEDVSTQARQCAIDTFKVLGCEGMGRVDMFLTKDNEIIVNEINTIPGFTNISMYPKLWEETGIGYAELITKLIHLAIERHVRRSALMVTAS